MDIVDITDIVDIIDITDIADITDITDITDNIVAKYLKKNPLFFLYVTGPPRDTLHTPPAAYYYTLPSLLSELPAGNSKEL